MTEMACIPVALLIFALSQRIQLQCQPAMTLRVLAEPTLMQCLLGTVPYRRVFTEMYSVLAVLASLCLIPLVRML